MTLKAAIEGMQPQAKGLLGPSGAGRDRKEPPLPPRREHGPFNIWISHFLPPEMWKSKCLLF